MIQYMIKRIVIGVLSLFVLVGIMLYKGILDILMKIHRSQ